ncbi:MAG TPA: tRNA (adenosine(37)-N6)-dimethylallyltransferase MiaA [bacterium]|nr:tRNA (adenosine(37)-N6)-dimethylallyltransferase MiaA [bacterium]
MSGSPRGAIPAPDALPPLVAVVGATASGKSGLALALAEALDGEIVNTDSMQVYRYFDIGTAKPTLAERERVPHHLIDVVEPDDVYSAGRYVADAQAAIAGIVARDRVPILCGGTGLYYRALVLGLVQVPPVPAAVQAAVEARVGAGSEAAYQLLAAVDAEAAASIHPNNPVRIARALAVYEATGRPLSAWRREQPFLREPARVFAVGVRWERAALYERIDRRVREMLAAGWVDEVQALLARGYGPELKPMQAIGYREIAEWLGAGGQPDMPEPAEPLAAVAERIARRTRQYAKRQLTWFRRHPEVHWAEPEGSEAIVGAVRNFLPRRHEPR